MSRPLSRLATGITLRSVLSTVGLYAALGVAFAGLPLVALANSDLKANHNAFSTSSAASSSAPISSAKERAKKTKQEAQLRDFSLLLMRDYGCSSFEEKAFTQITRFLRKSDKSLLSENEFYRSLVGHFYFRNRKQIPGSKLETDKKAYLREMRRLGELLRTGVYSSYENIHLLNNKTIIRGNDIADILESKKSDRHFIKVEIKKSLVALAKIAGEDALDMSCRDKNSSKNTIVVPTKNGVLTLAEHFTQKERGQVLNPDLVEIEGAKKTPVLPVATKPVAPIPPLAPTIVKPPVVLPAPGVPSSRVQAPSPHMTPAIPALPITPVAPPVVRPSAPVVPPQAPAKPAPVTPATPPAKPAPVAPAAPVKPQNPVKPTPAPVKPTTPTTPAPAKPTTPAHPPAAPVKPTPAPKPVTPATPPAPAPQPSTPPSTANHAATIQHYLSLSAAQVSAFQVAGWKTEYDQFIEALILHRHSGILDNFSKFAPMCRNISQFTTREQKLNVVKKFFKALAYAESGYHPLTETKEGGGTITRPVHRAAASDTHGLKQVRHSLGLFQLNESYKLYFGCEEIDYSNDVRIGFASDRAVKLKDSKGLYSEYLGDSRKTVLNPFINAACAVRVFEARIKMGSSVYHDKQAWSGLYGTKYASQKSKLKAAFHKEVPACK